LAEGVIGLFSNASLFFEGLNYKTKFILGFIIIIIGAIILDLSQEK
jgi:hypothetical protein